jgi:hypothetical protein
MKWLGQFAHAAVLVALVAGFLVYVESADSQQESRDALIAPACWADPQQVIEDGRQPLPLRNCAPSPHPGRDPISQPCPVRTPDMVYELHKAKSRTHGGPIRVYRDVNLDPGAAGAL